MNIPKTTHATATADDGTATVTISAGNKEAIYLTHLSAEFDGTVSDIAITIKDGTTVIWQQTIKDRYGDDWDFAIPLKATAGNDLVVELGASGTGGTSGTVHVSYYKGE